MEVFKKEYLSDIWIKCDWEKEKERLLLKYGNESILKNLEYSLKADCTRMIAFCGIEYKLKKGGSING